MSIVPNSGRSAMMPSMLRNLLFWVLMILLALVLWQMVSTGGHSNQGATSLNYSTFMNQVDANNVQTADVAVMQNTADISGKFKQDSGSYRTTIPRDTLPNLLTKLRQQGTDVQVTEGAARSNWVNFLVGVAPVILLVGVWIFMMRIRMKQNTNPPNQPTAGAIG